MLGDFTSIMHVFFLSLVTCAELLLTLHNYGNLFALIIAILAILKSMGNCFGSVVVVYLMLVLTRPSQSVSLLLELGVIGSGLELWTHARNLITHCTGPGCKNPIRVDNCAHAHARPTSFVAKRMPHLTRLAAHHGADRACWHEPHSRQAKVACWGNMFDSNCTLTKPKARPEWFVAKPDATQNIGSGHARA